LGSWISQRLGLDRSQSRTLLACGVAAATGSRFNAPVAGAIFALEVIVGNLSLRAGAPIFVSAVTGTAIGRFYFGNAPAFIVPEQELISLWEFPAFALLGIVVAVAAIGFMRAIFAVESVVAKGPCLRLFNDRYARAVLGSRTVFIVMSDGYDTAPAEELAVELARLKRRVRRLIWLNPLLGWAGYAPVNRAMTAAMPFIDTFAAAHSLDALAALEPELQAL
jgi:hypothetical protein